MKLTELETQDDIDRYQMEQEDAILEAGLKGVGLFMVIAVMAVVSLYLVNCTGLFS